MSAARDKVAFSEFATPIDRFEPVVPTSEYRLLGMRSRAEGPFLRETKFGTDISASRLNRVRAGDFIYSRLFAWQGSFGVIPPALDGCYVSNEFPLFTIDRERALPEYLVRWFALPRVQRRVEIDCTGSTPGTRNRYSEDHFLRLELALPPLQDQQRIAELANSLSSRLDEAKRLRAEIQSDAKALLHSVFHRLIQGAAYRPLGEVAPIVRRPVQIELDGEYPELGIRSFGKGTFHKPTLSAAEVGTKRLFRIRQGDLMLSNVFAWEGAIAVAGTSDDGRVGSHRFITCVADSALADANFLCFYLLTEEGLEQVREASPGGAGRNRTLGIRKLEQISVPLPCIGKQSAFTALQAKAQAIRTAQAANQAELDALLPAVLDKVFKGRL
jgi:type I restriction enzyme, S subunit